MGVDTLTVFGILGRQGERLPRLVPIVAVVWLVVVVAGSSGAPVRPTTSRAATMVLVGQEQVVGWHQDPDDGNKFRYWNGSEWSARAHTRIDPHGVFVGAVVQRKRRRVLDSRLFQNPVTFHVVAWFDCSVPLTQGRLRRFTRPVELRTLDQVRGGQGRP
jgi:hypothetical protein